MDKMRKAFIQLATERHCDLLDITESHHRNYCKKFGAEYFRYNSNPCEFLPPSWARIPTILEKFRDGYDVCVWMDSDAAICDIEQDIFSACHFGVGMALYLSPFIHYQAGVMVCHNSQLAVKYFTSVLKSGFVNDRSNPGRFGQWEQHSLNEIGIEIGVITSISVRWNLVPQHASHDAPAVLAAHGQPFSDRVLLMRKCVQGSRLV